MHWDHRAVVELNEYDKSVLKGERKLRELRTGGGRILVRPLYIRWHDREFVILAVGPESQVDGSGFRQAVKRAKDRAQADWGLDV